MNGGDILDYIALPAIRFVLTRPEAYSLPANSNLIICYELILLHFNPPPTLLLPREGSSMMPFHKKS